MPYTAPANVRLSLELMAAGAGCNKLYVKAAVKLMSNRCSQLIPFGLSSTRVPLGMSARVGQIILNVIVVVVIIIAVVISTTPLAAGTA